MNQLYTTKIFFLFFILIATSAYSQKTTLTGKVTTSDGKPAAYVNVVLKELNKGASTNESGVYSFKNISAGQHTIVVSFVGMSVQEKTFEVKANESFSLDFTIEESAAQLSEVVVNGSKSLNQKPVSVGKVAIKPMDLPQSVVVIDQALLEQQQVYTLSDVLKNLNGVYVMGNSGGYQEEIAGRGFAYNSSNTFKNGIRFNNGIKPEMSSLEKVELMKGSTAILNGNVSAGGVINLITKKPKFESGGNVALRVGSYSLYKPSLDVYGAINNSKTFAYRINTTYEKAGSFRNNVNSERFYINPSLLAKISDKTSFLLEADYLKDDRTPDYGIGAIDYKINNVPRSTFLGTSWQYNKVEQKSVTATLNHQLNKNWSLQLLAGYQKYNTNLFAASRPVGVVGVDGKRSATSINPDGAWARTLQRSQVNEEYVDAQINLNGEFKTGFLKHQLLVGIEADQYRTKTPAFKINYLNSKGVYDTINVFNPSTSEQISTIPGTSFLSHTYSVTGRGGVYIQDLLTITEKIKLLAGLRYTYQEIGGYSNTYNLIQAPASITWASIKTRYDDAFSPRVGLVYQPLKTTSIFASYSNSFSPNTGKDINNVPLAPSTYNQYEAGVKNDLFKGLLSFNVTTYKIITSNFAQSVFPILPEYKNPSAQELGGEITSNGVEVDLATKSYKGLTFFAGYSFNETKYTKSKINDVGSRLRYNPSNTANLSVNYVFDNKALKGLELGFTAFYFGKRYAGRSVTKTNSTFRLIPLDPYFNFDLSAGYTFDKISLRARVTNVFNALSYNVHDDNSINPIAPRQFALTLAYKL